MVSLAAGDRIPTRGTLAGCCARAASGHAAAPPSAASNSRRPMVTVIRPSRARCVKERIPRLQRAVFTSEEAGCWLLPPQSPALAALLPAASSSRTPPSRPRAAPRSRALGCDKHGGVREPARPILRTYLERLELLRPQLPK